MATTRIVRNEAEWQRARTALAYGMLNLGFAIEANAKTKVPVRTGNLRRSIHTLAFMDGREIGRSGDVPDYAGDTAGIGVIVGTNTNYGIFVELGTVRMAPRPYLTPAATEEFARAGELIAAGAKSYFGR